MTHARIAPGCRRLTEAHLQVHAMAERFEGLPIGVSKGHVLSAFKKASQSLGISPRLRDAVDVLFAFSEAQDWQAGSRPIVWPSNRKLERALCLGCRQVQNILNALIRAGLITPVDSPTGKRWGKRDDKTGKIVEAYGFDLSPVGLRFREFVAVSERACLEEREEAAWRRRLTIVRKAIQQVTETALEYSLTDRNWEEWAEKALALTRTVVSETAIPALIRVVTELEERRREAEAALTKALAVDDFCGRSEEISPRDERNCTLNTSTNQPSADKSATGRKDPKEGRSGRGGRASSQESGAHKRSQEEERSEEEPPSITPRFVLKASPELRDYVSSSSPNWSDVVEAASSLSRRLGISRSGWIEACEVMGRYQAATAVAVIAAKGETISKPGGYLRGMTNRARDGELHLNKSLWGLARRKGLGECCSGSNWHD